VRAALVLEYWTMDLVQKNNSTESTSSVECRFPQIYIVRYLSPLKPDQRGRIVE
jgi:hypothetical protein